MLQVTAERLMMPIGAFLYFAETLATLGTVLGLALGNQPRQTAHGDVACH